MKKIFTSISIIAIAAIALSSCNKEQKPSEVNNKTFTMNINAHGVDTKAIVNSDLSTSWEASDKIGVRLGKLGTVAESAQAGAAGKSANFSVTLTDGGTLVHEEQEKDTLILVSPYSAITSTSADLNGSYPKVAVKVPTAQTCTETSPDPTAIILWARQQGVEDLSSVEVTFAHATSYLHFVFTDLAEDEKITSCTFNVSASTGKKVAGTGYIEFATNPSLKSSSAKNEITVNPNYTTKTDRNIWAGVFRGDKIDNIALTVVTNKGTYTKTIKPTQFTLIAGKVHKLTVSLSTDSSSSNPATFTEA